MLKRVAAVLLFLPIICFSQTQPNIILILADDLGYSDLSCYGHPLIQTPFLDQMASNGLKATNYIVASPSCTPSRYSLLTGRYSTRSGLIRSFSSGEGPGMAQNELTIAKFLQLNNYHTAIIGKWGLGDAKPWNHPNAQGFDFFYGMLYSNDYREPYDKEDSVIKIFRQHTVEIVQPADSLLTQLYTKEAIAYIKNQSSSQPFFLYLAHNMPHLPIAASAKFRNTSQAGLYGDVINELDASCDSIWKVVEEKGMSDNTIFIFASDNGPWIGYPPRMASDSITKPWFVGSTGIFKGAKGECYEGGCRVPFILYWKNHVPSGEVIRQPISCIDILPTIASFTALSIPDSVIIDGRSVADLLTGKVQSIPDRPLYYVVQGSADAVRLGPWKIIKNVSGTDSTAHIYYELYNLDLDPGERTNVAAANPEKTKEMIELLEKYLK